MSDEGGSDLDIFEGLEKKDAPPAGRQQKTLLGLAAPVVPGTKGAPPPPPPTLSKIPPLPPQPSKAPPPPPPTLSKAPLPPPPTPGPQVSSSPFAAAAPPPSFPAATQGGSAPSFGAVAPPPRTSPSRVPPPPPPGSLVEPTPNPVIPPPVAAVAPPVAPPTPQPASAPLAQAERDLDWDDEDEKTTVFDRSNEESAAQALLYTSPKPAVEEVSQAPAPVVVPPPSAPAAVAPPPSTVPDTLSSSGAGAAAPAAAIPAVTAAPVSSAAAPAAAAIPVASAPVAAAAPVVVKEEKSKTPLFLLVGGLIALAAGGYYFLNKPDTGSLVIRVAGPQGRAVGDVSILVNNEERCTQSPCIVEGLTGGKSHIVQVKAPGYAAPAGEAVKVTAGEETPLRIDLSPASVGTGIRVSSQVTGLRLLVDGKEVGPLPQELTDLQPGAHTIEVSGNPYFAPFTKKVDVPLDEIVEINPTLQFVKGQITVELGNNAQGAKIWLRGDGEDKALHRLTLPQSISIPADKKMTLVAEKKGFNNYVQEIQLSADEPEKTYRISLVEEGRSTATPPARPTPTPAPAATAPPATTATPAPTSSPPPATPTGTAKLNINSIPLSSVLLDGKPLGTTPKLGVVVTPGSHNVTFIHPEHGRKNVTVTVADGQTGTAAVRFP